MSVIFGSRRLQQPTRFESLQTTLVASALCHADASWWYVRCHLCQHLCERFVREWVREHAQRPDIQADRIAAGWIRETDSAASAFCRVVSAAIRNVALCTAVRAFDMQASRV